MATELERSLFDEELRELQGSLEGKRWGLERDDTVPLGLFLALHPQSHPTELYKARIHWSNYFGPPSLKFVHPTSGGVNDPSAWPQCPGFRPPSLDACVPWTAEGHGLHPEWKNSPEFSFPSLEAPMHYIARRLQLTLDSNYQGRGA